MIKYLAEVHRGAHGFVMDENGNPVERAAIKVKGRDVTYHTTKYGEFWRILLPGTYRIDVSSSLDRLFVGHIGFYSHFKEGSQKQITGA